jgi:hypothetical protein
MPTKKVRQLIFPLSSFLLLLDPGSGIEKNPGSATLFRRVDNPALKTYGIYGNPEQKRKVKMNTKITGRR